MNRHQFNLAFQAWRYFANAFYSPGVKHKIMNTALANIYCILGIPKLITPIRAYFNITTVCNNQCLICAYRKKKDYKGKHLDFQFVKQVNQAFPSLLSVCFTGDGEPLLYPKISDAVEMFARKNCWVNLTSNGTLLTHTMVNELVHAGLSEIQISLDGASRAMIKRMRPNTDPEFVKEGISNLIHISKQIRRKPVFVILSFCITRINVNEVDLMVEMGKELGVGGIRFQKFHPYPGEELSLPEDQYRQIKKKILSMAEAEKHRLYIFLDDVTVSENKYAFSFIRSRCVHPFFNISVQPDGNIYPCCGAVTDTIGNINKKPIHKIVLGQKRKEFLDKICSDNPPLKCMQCMWLRKP